MSILDTFFILFESDTSKLDDGLESSDKKAKGFLERLKDVDKQASKTGANFRDMVGKLAAFAGVNLAFGAIVAGIRSTAQEYTALDKLATQFRSTVEAVDEFRDAASLLGITEEHSTESLHSLERAAQDAAMGMGRAQKVFEELGITVTDGNGEVKATTSLMTELAGKFEGMDKGKQIRVMERLGLDPALLKLFNADLGALQKRMEDVDRASGFNLQTAVKRANEYTKASKSLGIEVNTLRMYLGKMSEAFRVAALPWFTDAINLAAKYVGKFVAFLMEHKNFVQGFMVAAGAAISYFLIPAAIKGAIAVWAMLSPFLLIGLAVAAVATAFALLYDDIVTFMEGGDSMIGSLLQKFPAVAAALRFIGDTAKAVWQFIAGLFDTAKLMDEAAPGEAWAKLKEDVTAALDALMAAFPALKAGFDSLMTGIRAAGSTIADVWDAIVAAVRLAIGVLTAGVEAVAGVVGKVKGALGIGGTATGAAAAQGQGMLAAASGSPLASTSSSSIQNTALRGGDKTVSVGTVNIQTQATDAEGIARGVGKSLGSHLRQASSQFDDGVAA